MDISLLDTMAQAKERGEPVALAIVVATRGSTPRKAGAAMIVGQAGRMAGTVGGGLVEARALEEAQRRLKEGGSSFLNLNLGGQAVVGDAPICGGEVEILVLAIDDATPYALAKAEIEAGRPALAIYDVSADAVERGSALAAIIDSKGNALWGAASLDATTAASALRGEALRSGDSLFYDPLLPLERLIVLGGGHVGRALARIAVELGFDVWVADPRPEYSDPAAFPPGVATMRESFEYAIRNFAPKPSDYAVVVSPGHQGDAVAVRSLLAYELKYLGFIGSRRKTRMMLDQLKAEGFDPERVERLCAPIGLDIGAQTPEEIAISIAAELVAYRRSGPCLSYLHDERLERRARPYL